MTRLFKGLFGDAVDYFLTSPAAVLKAFLAAVLVQFSILSFVSIVLPNGLEVVPTLHHIVQTSDYWWGLVSLIGAVFFVLEYHVRNWVVGQVVGYTSAIVSFGALVYDFAFRNPPVYAGVVLASTATIFIGGLVYDRLRRC